MADAVMAKQVHPEQITDPFSSKVVIIGPNKVENLNTVLGQYDGNETTFSWDEEQKIDLDDITVYATEAFARYHTGTATVINSTHLDTGVRLASTSFRGQEYPRHSSFYDRDCQVGDIVQCFKSGEIFTTRVAGLTGIVEPAAVSEVVSGPNNAVEQEDDVSWEKTGPENGVDISEVDVSDYNGEEFGAINTEYVLRVTTPGAPTQAKLRVYNTHGDEEQDVEISNWGIPTPIGARGLKVTFRSPWLNAAHPYRRKITIQTANLDGDLDGFPVYIPITSSIHGNKILGGANPAVFFYDGNGSQIPFDLEDAYDTGSQNYIYYFWVRLSLKQNPGERDNTIWIYYGGTSGATANPSATFAGHDFVTHMKDKTSSVVESKIGPDGTKFEANKPQQIRDGLAVCQQFGNNDIMDYVNFTNTIGGYTDQNFTIEAWVYIPPKAPQGVYNETILSRSKVFGVWEQGDPLGGWVITTETAWGGSPIRFWFYFYDQGGVNYSRTISGSYVNNQWLHLAVVRTGSQVKFYVNGIDKTQDQQRDATTLLVPTRVCLAGKYYYDPDAKYKGLIDEIRFSSTPKSQAWLKFETANFLQSDNELTWGNEENIQEFEEQAGFLLGQMWWIKVKKAFVPPTATSSGNYKGLTEIQYAVVVTKGGNNPQITCYSLTGKDASGPTDVTVNVPAPVGTYGARIKFDRFPLCKNDTYYFTAFPSGIAEKKILKLASPLPWTSVDGFSLYIPGTFIVPRKYFFPTKTGITIYNNAYVTHHTFTSNKVRIPIPLAKAVLVAQTFTISDKHTDAVYTCRNLVSLLDIDGELRASNPLKFATFAAFYHSGSVPVYFIGVKDPRSAESWLEALQKVVDEKDLTLASIVPLTSDPEILDSLFAAITSQSEHVYRTLWVGFSQYLPYYVVDNVSVTISQTNPGQYNKITAVDSAPFESVKVGDVVRIEIDDGVYLDTVEEVESSTIIKTKDGYSRAVSTPIDCRIYRIVFNRLDELDACAALASRYSSEQVRLVYTDNLVWKGYVSYYAIPAVLAALRSSLPPQAVLDVPLYDTKVLTSDIEDFYRLGWITVKKQANEAVVYRSVVPVLRDGLPIDETGINIRQYVYRRIWSVLQRHTKVFERQLYDASVYVKALIGTELDNIMNMFHPRYGKVIDDYIINNVSYIDGEFTVDLTLKIPSAYRNITLTITTQR